MEQFHCLVFDIPTDSLDIIGGGTDSFERISRTHIDYLQQQVGINPSSNISIRSNRMDLNMPMNVELVGQLLMQFNMLRSYLHGN